MRTDKYVIAKEPRSQRRRYSGTYRLRTHWLPLIVMILALGVIAPAVAAQSKPPSFDGSRTYSALGGTTNGVTAVATGDFNGDGKPDFAAATPDTDGVSVFLNNGDGTFSKAVRYATGKLPDYVAIGDFNRDGKLDLVTANAGNGGTVSVLLGNGDGTFQPASNSPAGVSTTALAVGDFNHDGKLDVVVVNNSNVHPSALFVLLGKGDGTFQTPMSVAIPDYQYFIVTADFDGDGNLDLVTGNTNDFWILHGNGDGTFGPAVSISTTGGSPYGNAIAVGDFNGDGKLDLAIVDSTAEVSSNIPGGVNILLGNGNGTFRPPLPFQTGIYPFSVATADFNGDGKLDVAVANARDCKVSILFGNGDGTLQAATNYPVGANWTTALAVADIDGDGSPDVGVSSGLNTDTVSILLNKGSGAFHDVASFAVGDQPDAVFASQPYAIVTADFSHDGNLDIAVPNSGTKDVSVILGNGNGSFGAATNYKVGTLPTFIKAADFNRDGNPDLAVVNHGDGTISILLGNGDGIFQTAINYSAGGSNPTALIVADFNGDGKLDLVVGSLGASNENQISVLRGNGDGMFQAAVNSIVPGNGIEDLTGGDFNGDGKPDLAVANYNSTNVAIMLGDGDGTFQPAASLLAAFGPVSVATGDYNGDGKADLAIGNFFTSTISVFIGKGDGTFQASPISYGVGNDPLGIVVADLNGDSKPDLAVVNVNDQYISILAGKGDGTFQEPINYGTGKGPAAIAIGDFNRDGKPDFATPSFWFDSVSILLNNTPAVGATATPTPTSTPRPTPTPTTTPTPTATATPTATPTSTPSATPTPPPTATPARLLNISTRLNVQTGDKVGIAGFIITGTRSRTVITRGLGPSLNVNGNPVAGRLDDPTLELRDHNGALIAFDDNWKDTQQSQIEATGLAPQDDNESAIVQTLSPAAYTAIIRGKNDTSGIGLVEVYDLDKTSDAQLANISTRGFVDSGDNVVIGGFISGPSDRSNPAIVLRAIGPSLSNKGISNSLQDPTLELHDENGAVIAANDNWLADPNATKVATVGLAPEDPRESALYVTLPPGASTAVVRGKNNMVGVALVEIYNLGQP